jgi:hypothetical protein
MKLFTNSILEKNEVVKSHSGALPQHSGLFCLDTTVFFVLTQKKEGKRSNLFRSLSFNVHSLGRCPKPYLLFCLEIKKEEKKVKTAPVSLEKLSFGRLKSSNLLKFDHPFIKMKRSGTNFNFEQGRFLIAFLTYFSAHRPRSIIE